MTLEAKFTDASQCFSDPVLNRGVVCLLVPEATNAHAKVPPIAARLTFNHFLYKLTIKSWVL